MKDSYNREIDYLRISVTDLCNLRCNYCMPECGVKKLSHDNIMNAEEIEEFVSYATRLGIRKVRLTGGEPLVRRGIIEICRKISSLQGIEELCMTTNGLLLDKYAHDLKLAGVKRFNISIDTLQDAKYKTITRCDQFDHPVKKIFDGIEKIRSEGFKNIKINVVLQGGVNDDEIEDFINLTKDNDYEVRFIELMPIGPAKEFAQKTFITNDVVLAKDTRLKHSNDSGVSKIYTIKGYKGKIGLISPVSNHFCEFCNRIRLTADGKIKMCLHSNKEVLIKGLHGEELYKAIQDNIQAKPKNFDIGIDNPSNSLRGMNQIGG